MSPTQKIFFGNMFSENLYVEQAIHTSTKNSLATGQSLPVRLFLVHYGRMHKSNLPGCLFQLASKVLTGKQWIQNNTSKGIPLTYEIYPKPRSNFPFKSSKQVFPRMHIVGSLKYQRVHHDCKSILDARKVISEIFFFVGGGGTYIHNL